MRHSYSWTCTRLYSWGRSKPAQRLVSSTYIPDPYNSKNRWLLPSNQTLLQAILFTTSTQSMLADCHASPWTQVDLFNHTPALLIRICSTHYTISLTLCLIPAYVNHSHKTYLKIDYIQKYMNNIAWAHKRLLPLSAIQYILQIISHTLTLFTPSASLIYTNMRNYSSQNRFLLEFLNKLIPPYYLAYPYFGSIPCRERNQLYYYAIFN